MSHISISSFNTSSSMAFKSKFNQHIHLVQCIPTLVLRWKQVLNHVCHVWFQSKCLRSVYKHKSKPIWIVRLRRYYIAIFTFTCKRRKNVSIRLSVVTISKNAKGRKEFMLIHIWFVFIIPHSSRHMSIPLITALVSLA